MDITKILCTPQYVLHNITLVGIKSSSHCQFPSGRRRYGVQKSKSSEKYTWIRTTRARKNNEGWAGLWCKDRASRFKKLITSATNSKTKRKKGTLKWNVEGTTRNGKRWGDTPGTAKQIWDPGWTFGGVPPTFPSIRGSGVSAWLMWTGRLSEQALWRGT